MPRFSLISLNGISAAWSASELNDPEYAAPDFSIVTVTGNASLSFVHIPLQLPVRSAAPAEERASEAKARKDKRRNTKTFDEVCVHPDTQHHGCYKGILSCFFQI